MITRSVSKALGHGHGYHKSSEGHGHRSGANTTTMTLSVSATTGSMTAAAQTAVNAVRTRDKKRLSAAAVFAAGAPTAGGGATLGAGPSASASMLPSPSSAFPPSITYSKLPSRPGATSPVRIPQPTKRDNQTPTPGNMNGVSTISPSPHHSSRVRPARHDTTGSSSTMSSSLSTSVGGFMTSTTNNNNSTTTPPTTDTSDSSPSQPAKKQLPISSSPSVRPNASMTTPTSIRPPSRSNVSPSPVSLTTPSPTLHRSSSSANRSKPPTTGPHPGAMERQRKTSFGGSSASSIALPTIREAGAAGAAPTRSLSRPSSRVGMTMGIPTSSSQQPKHTSASPVPPSTSTPAPSSTLPQPQPRSTSKSGLPSSTSHPPKTGSVRSKKRGLSSDNDADVENVAPKDKGKGKERMADGAGADAVEEGGSAPGVVKRSSGRHARSSAVFGANASPQGRSAALPPPSNTLSGKARAGTVGQTVEVTIVRPGSSGSASGLSMMPRGMMNGGTGSSRLRAPRGSVDATAQGFLAPPGTRPQPSLSPTPMSQPAEEPSSKAAGPSTLSRAAQSSHPQVRKMGRSPVPPPSSTPSSRSDSPASTAKPTSQPKPKAQAQAQKKAPQSALLFHPATTSGPSLPSIMRTSAAAEARRGDRVVSTTSVSSEAPMFKDDSIVPTLAFEGPPGSLDNSFESFHSEDGDGDAGNMSAILQTTLSPLRTPALQRMDNSRFFITPAKNSSSPGDEEPSTPSSAGDADDDHTQTLPTRQQLSYLSPTPASLSNATGTSANNARLRPGGRPPGNDRGSIFSFDVLVERSRNLNSSVGSKGEVGLPVDDEMLDFENTLADIQAPFKGNERLSILLPPGIEGHGQGIGGAAGAEQSGMTSPTSPVSFTSSAIASPTLHPTHPFSSTPDRRRRSRSRDAARANRNSKIGNTTAAAMIMKKRSSIPKLTLSSPKIGTSPLSPARSPVPALQPVQDDAQLVQQLRHQLESRDVQISQQTTEITSLQSQLSATQNALESTQHACQSHQSHMEELERDVSLAKVEREKDEKKWKVREDVHIAGVKAKGEWKVVEELAGVESSWLQGERETLKMILMGLEVSARCLVVAAEGQSLSGR